MGKVKGFFIFLLLCSGLAYAHSSCKKAAFLQGGFNLDHYQKCLSFLQNCPKNGALLDENCVDQLAKKQMVCQQFNQFAKEINADVNSLSATTVGKYTVIDQVFIADGQHLFYILSPSGCYVNATFDPRRLDKMLSKKVKNSVLMIANYGKPTHQTIANGGDQFTVHLKVTKNCMACELVGFATIQFGFNAKGQLVKTKLIEFSEETPKTD